MRLATTKDTPSKTKVIGIDYVYTIIYAVLLHQHGTIDTRFTRTIIVLIYSQLTATEEE